MNADGGDPKDPWGNVGPGATPGGGNSAPAVVAPAPAVDSTPAF